MTRSMTRAGSGLRNWVTRNGMNTSGAQAGDAARPGRQKKGKTKLMGKRKPFRPGKPKAVIPTEKAPEVEALAADLIERYHPGLKTAVIRYGFTAKKSKLWGKVVLVREEAQTLLERKVAFMVIVRKAAWEASDQGRREAALDELLCSMSYDGMVPRIEKPDFKGFRANILRYGVQTDELADAFRGCQLILPGTDEIERELAPAPLCDDCGDPADAEAVFEGRVLCPVCWKWRHDALDPESSNADDDGAHCEGCGSWGREGRLTEMADARLLCWKCAEAVGTDADEGDADEVAGEAPLADGTSVTLSYGDKSVTMTGEQFAKSAEAIADMSSDEIAAFAGVDVLGVDFTEHATAGAAQ